MTHAVVTNDNPDIVVCRAEYRHDARRPGRIIDGLPESTTIDRKTTLELLLDGRIQGFLWSKLIRRSCLGDDPFPELTSQSDFVGFVRAVDKAQRVTIIPDVLYRYVRRPDSLTRVRTPVLGNLLIARDALLDIARRDPGLNGDTQRFDYFAAWFYCAAVAFTPIRSNSSQTTRDEGLRRAREGLQGIRLLPIALRRPSVGLSLLAIRHAGPLYGLTVGILLTVKDRARRFAIGTSPCA